MSQTFRTIDDDGTDDKFHSESEAVACASTLLAECRAEACLQREWPDRTESITVVRQLWAVRKTDDGNEYELARLSPDILPTPDDFMEWLKSDQFCVSRLSGIADTVGYEVWRQAWKACERAHGIRA